MRSTDRQTDRQAIPNWGFAPLHVLAETHRLLAAIEREPRIGEHLQVLRDALRVVQMSLSVCEHNTPQVLAERIEAPTALRMKLLTVKLPGAEDEPDDEVAFWRGFVTWWAREKAEPVPERAWQALALAQRRAAQRQDQQYDGGGGGQ